MKFLMVFIGGGTGSVLRYGISLLTGAMGLRLPVATLLSNILASICLVLAVLWIQRQQLSDSIYPYLLVIGFCGGLSTFSTFSWETFALLRAGQPVLAVINIVLNLALAVGVVFWLMGRWGNPSGSE